VSSAARSKATSRRTSSRAATPSCGTDRNIELGVLIRDRALALTIRGYFRSLIDRDLLKPLPLA
jgi:hypothetical protein